jgi:hypothetical protein
MSSQCFFDLRLVPPPRQNNKNLAGTKVLSYLIFLRFTNTCACVTCAGTTGAGKDALETLIKGR